MLPQTKLVKLLAEFAVDKGWQFSYDNIIPKIELVKGTGMGATVAISILMDSAATASVAVHVKDLENEERSDRPSLKKKVEATFSETGFHVELVEEIVAYISGRLRACAVTKDVAKAASEFESLERKLELEANGG